MPAANSVSVRAFVAAICACMLSEFNNSSHYVVNTEYSAIKLVLSYNSDCLVSASIFLCS